MQKYRRACGHFAGVSLPGERMIEDLLTIHRARLTGLSPAEVRVVYHSEVVAANEDAALAPFLRDTVPGFYRPIADLTRDISAGYTISPLLQNLIRLPTADSFRESHLGEIVACHFAERVLSLRKLYSKLSTLTSENANAYKMDLVLYDPASSPLEFVFGEVKCSPKSPADGMPPGHDRSCFPKLFRSLNDYGKDDLAFDLAAIADAIRDFPPDERDRIRRALLPYATKRIRYLGITVIDAATFVPEEARMLGTWSSNKAFDVDVVGIERFGALADEVYGPLDQLRRAMEAVCSRPMS